MNRTNCKNTNVEKNIGFFNPQLPLMKLFYCIFYIFTSAITI